MKKLLIALALICVVSYAKGEFNDTLITDSGKIVNSYLISVDGTKEKIRSVNYKNDQEWVEMLMNSDTLSFLNCDSMITFHTSDYVSTRIYRNTISDMIYAFQIKDVYKTVHTINLMHKNQILGDCTTLDRIIGKAIVSSYNNNIVNFESKFNSESGINVSYDTHVRKVFNDRIIEQYFIGNAIMAVIIIYTKPVMIDTNEKRVKPIIKYDGSVDG